MLRFPVLLALTLSSLGAEKPATPKPTTYSVICPLEGGHSLVLIDGARVEAKLSFQSYETAWAYWQLRPEISYASLFLKAKPQLHLVGTFDPTTGTIEAASWYLVPPIARINTVAQARFDPKATKYLTKLTPDDFTPAEVPITIHGTTRQQGPPQPFTPKDYVHK